MLGLQHVSTVPKWPKNQMMNVWNAIECREVLNRWFILWFVSVFKSEFTIFDLQMLICGIDQQALMKTLQNLALIVGIYSISGISMSHLAGAGHWHAIKEWRDVAHVTPSSDGWHNVTSRCLLYCPTGRNRLFSCLFSFFGHIHKHIVFVL